MWRTLACALPVLLLPAPGAAQLPRPLGPLGAEEGAPFQRLGYTPMVEGAVPVPVGTLRVDAWLGYANLFEQDSSAAHYLYQDMERAITALTLRYGAAEGLEVGGRLTLENDWGGFLDPYIVAFHSSIGMGDRHRTAFREGRFGAYLRNGAGDTVLELPRHALALTDVRIFAKWRMAEKPMGTVALRTVVRIPTTQPTVGTERADVGVMALGTWSMAGFHLHGMAGGATVRRGIDTRDLLRSRQWFGMIGLERPFHERRSAVVELTASTQLLRDVGDHDIDGAPTNLLFGLVGVTEGGWRWELGMQEDVPPRGPSLDFTLQFALGWSW